MEPKSLIDLGNVLAIILSIVSLTITVIGFFASLKFYRDGVKLQTLANDTIARIEEKALSIQTQVGGMFDKTLDAALGKSEKLDSSFEALNQQLENTAKAIVETAQKKIGAAGDEERKKLASIVEKQMEPLRARLEETRESAAEVVESRIPSSPITRNEERILEFIPMNGEPITSTEIAKSLGIHRQMIVQYLHRLMRSGYLIRETKNAVSTYRRASKSS